VPAFHPTNSPHPVAKSTPEPGPKIINALQNHKAVLIKSKPSIPKLKFSNMRSILAKAEHIEEN
jgi:hypothetical protein